MDVLAVSGSLRTSGTNAALVGAAALLAHSNLSVRVFARLADIPPFNPELDAPGRLPELAAMVREEVTGVAALVISCPEYAHGLPGTFKNMLDWLVGDARFAGMPVALWNGAPRAVHAPAQLREVLSTMAARIIEPASVTLDVRPGASADDVARDPCLSPLLSAALDRLVSAARDRGGDGAEVLEAAEHALDGVAPADCARARSTASRGG